MKPQAPTTARTAAPTPGYAWVVLLSVYAATLAAPLNQMKVPPVLPILRDAFGLDYSSAGMLMSIFSIMGFVLAIPAGFILQKIGIKATGLVSVGTVAVGAAMGALSGSAALLFTGRFIEGAGMGLIMVAAPSAIAVWFPAARRGLPMAIWTSSVGLASIAALNGAPALAGLYSWRAVWWAGAAVAAAAFGLFALLFRLPRPSEAHEIPEVLTHAAAPPPVSLGRAMANRSLWFVGVSFGCFNLTVMAWTTFYPDFLHAERAYSLAGASFITSMMMVIATISGMLGGHLSDRIGSRKRLIVFPFAFLALVFLFPFSVTGWGIPALVVFAGLVAGPIAPVSLAAVPEIMGSPRLAGIGLGVAALCQNLGMFIGPALFGRILEVAPWTVAGYLMIPVCVLAIVVTVTAKIR